MSWGDFLRKKAQTPWTEQFVMAGALGTISTNSQEILQAARVSFLPEEGTSCQPRLRFRFWVDPHGTTLPPWPKPTFRGLDHLIFAGLDAQNSILVDRQRRVAIGRLTPAMAADQARWKSMIFPNLLSLIGPAVGITGLHCACVARDGRGILLSGRSGSGKSTLTLALAQKGFSFLSDDWTYFSECDAALCAWGLIPRLKLLPDAATFFPELAGIQTTISENGEEAYEMDPDSFFRIMRTRTCEPRQLVFLERSSKPGFAFTRMPAAQAVTRLEEDLLADTPEALHTQSEIIRRLAEHGCWQLYYGEAPATVAQNLARLFS